MRRQKKPIHFLRTYILFPLSLLFLWFILTFWYISTFESFSIIPYNHKDVVTQYINEPLLKGEKISATFTANENNFGILALRFQLRSRVPYASEDVLVFRIKEVGDNKWYYQNEYRSGLTYDVPFLPFGFPPIADSKDKTYYFELISLKGNQNNALILSSQYPQVQSKYLIDKSKLTADPQFLAVFIRQKYIASFDNPSVTFSSIIYALPLLFYLAWVTNILQIVLRPFSKQINWISKKLSIHIDINRITSVVNGWSKEIVVFFILVLLINVLYDIFVVQILNDIVYIVIISLWLILIKPFASKEKLTFMVSIILLVITGISYSFGFEAVAEKGIAWTYMFLLAGFIMLFKYIHNNGLAKKRQSK